MKLYESLYVSKKYVYVETYHCKKIIKSLKIKTLQQANREIEINK